MLQVCIYYALSGISMKSKNYYWLQNVMPVRVPPHWGVRDNKKKKNIIWNPFVKKLKAVFFLTSITI